ncbi:Uncharacterized protein APZ42_027599 [Daphnia magna]|uniref:Uncharacterized protein n=1 Tax=Daphnia magna TaxID=35525 RepID=A0A164R8A5_9CRUS|nr:Uncharacterized protein APZ42_027599 [Daphnia magna]
MSTYLGHPVGFCFGHTLSRQALQLKVNPSTTPFCSTCFN